MQYEIDYIPVGEGEKSGDAICLRFGNLQGARNEQTVIVIDGGDKKSGETLVAHVRDYYGTTNVDYVVSTHPDADHASGLSTVLEELNVEMLLMHRPWNHAADIKDAFSDGRWTARGLEENIEKSLTHVNELETLAIKKGVKIIEPFQGIKTTDGSIHFLGPSKEFYQEMLSQFRSTPKPKIENSLIGTILQKTTDAVRFIEDTFDIDLLNDDEDSTSPENNTSAILLLTLGSDKFLFTGDAGKTALLASIDYANGNAISLIGMRFFDVPHHGSRRNLNSKILKKMNATTAFISATGKNEKHPSKRVTNALKKHGATVYVNKQEILLHHEGSTRGWGAAPSEPFHSKVEE